jgi:glycosyltransferase involved in cell wall biosynthesis
MISFIVPAYNEEAELSSTIAAIHVAAWGVAQPYEIIEGCIFEKHKPIRREL